MTNILFGFFQQICSLASGFGKKRKLLILIYHQVMDGPDFMRPWEIDKTEFSWQMSLMAKYFNVLSFPEAIEKMANHTLPPRAVCITFDDGYANNYTNALPVLLNLNLSAVFFIASGFLDGGRMWNDTVIESIRNYPAESLDLSPIGLGRYDISSPTKKAEVALEVLQKVKHLQPEIRSKYVNHLASLVVGLPENLMLTSDQLTKLYESGMEIGGHTISHPILANLTPDQVRQEIQDNKTVLEKKLKTSIQYFAYPNGKPDDDYLPEQVEIVKSCGFSAACSTQISMSSSADDRWQLPRFTPWDRNPLRFMARIAKMYWLNKP